MKRHLIILVTSLYTCICALAQPPNNAIFNGSTGDGFTKDKNSSISNSIFAGSTGDGFTKANNVALSNNIFQGGIGDGWANTKNLVSANSIFAGGVGDGWTRSANVSVSNNIFLGSIGDGWSKQFNISAANNIFFGGQGDGWSSIYRPVGPLPVTLLYFNIQKQVNKAVLLSWKTTQEINSSFFEIQRSSDAIFYTTIATVQAAGNSNTPVAYTFTDRQPMNGLNYYRLKQVDLDSRFNYTPSKVVNFDDSNAGIVKYYPNPTKDLVTVELTNDMVKEMGVINISNVSGVVLKQIKLSPGTNTTVSLDLAPYPKGIYFIQVKTSKENSVQRIVLQ
ncbi:MAG: T9SS type A sorting domain-containing protein [Ferruginibacter sp.]